jgi:hypothetical protein
MLRSAICFLCMLLIVGIAAIAQTSAQTVAGVVSDASGDVMAKADITLIASAANHQEVVKLTTHTDESGHYSFSNIPAVGVAGIVLDVTKDGKKPQSHTFTIKAHRDGVSVIDITVSESRQ